MKCPYTCDVERVSQNSYEHDDDGYNTFNEEKIIEHRTYIDCLKDDCAAFYDGRCHYKE